MKIYRHLLLIISLITISFFSINNVSAETVNYSHLNTFTENVGSENKIISSVEGTATVKDEALYLDGSTYIKYNLNSSLATKLVFDFDFYKSNTSSYPRMLLLGGIEREIEVKGSSDSMYINGEVSAGWLQNEWNNMRIEYENGTITYFVNDVQVKQESYSDTLTYIQFGKGSSSSNMFNGYIDNLTIYMDSEEITDNMIILNDAWFKGILKYDTTNKAVYVRNNDESEYTLLFNYTKEYFVIQYQFGGLTFVESDIGPIYFTTDNNYNSNSSCSHNSEGFDCFSDNTGDIGRNDFMHTLQYSLSSKTLGRDLPFGAKSGDILKSNTNIYSLDDNSLIFEKNVVDTTTPTISISKGDNIITSIDDVDYITGVNMVVSTNITDDSKYICMLSTDTENWDYYNCSETYTYKLTQNGTLYARIVDKESESTINSATYTISSIQDLPLVGDKVTIYFQKITEDVDSELYNQCTIEQGTVSYRACETFSISFDVINYNKYIYEMSLDGVTWEDVSTRLYNNFFLERIFENKTIYIRVVNRSDYSLNNYSTFTVSSIETPTELGQKVLFSSSYYIQSPDIDVMALFINYDSTNYNYYYSLYNTSESFIDITDSIECTNNLCTFETRIYVKGTMYVRIEDKSGNLVHTATYTVDYYNWMNSNNPFDKEDFFGTFFDSFDYFLNPIKEIFNSISIFFDSLPIEIKYTFYVAFVIIIILFLIKFIL